MMFMKRPRRPHGLVLALYVNAALMAAVLVALLGRHDTPTLTPAALGQVQQQFPPAQQPIAGGAGLFIVPGQFSSNVWGLYLLDVDQQTICAYTVTGSPPQLKLIAARGFRYDRRLSNYNVGGLTPVEVKDMIEKEQNNARVPAADGK
jgi:hypothetical protein